MSEIGRPHPAVERYVSKAVSPNERIAALEAEVERLQAHLRDHVETEDTLTENLAEARAEVERLTRERDEARAERASAHLCDCNPAALAAMPKGDDA